MRNFASPTDMIMILNYVNKYIFKIEIRRDAMNCVSFISKIGLSYFRFSRIQNNNANPILVVRELQKVIR